MTLVLADGDVFLMCVFLSSFSTYPVVFCCKKGLSFPSLSFITYFFVCLSVPMSSRRLALVSGHRPLETVLFSLKTTSPSVFRVLT